MSLLERVPGTKQTDVRHGRGFTGGAPSDPSFGETGRE